MNADHPPTTADAKEKKSIAVIEEARRRYGAQHIALAWSGGKDSTTVLYLIVKHYHFMPFPVIIIDTTVKFPEVYRFWEKMGKKWNFTPQIACNKEALKTITPGQNKEECCFLLKTTPLNQAIMKNKWRAVISAIRYDETPERRNEFYFSPRKDPDHMRIHPILHFSEADIWTCIHKNRIPYCELYESGYRSLGCLPCTFPVQEQSGGERSGRSREKEERMFRLRSLGYF